MVIKEKQSKNIIEYHIPSKRSESKELMVTLLDESKNYIIIENPQSFKGKLKEFFVKLFHPKKGILYSIPLKFGDSKTTKVDQWDMIKEYHNEMHRRDELSKSCCKYDSTESKKENI